MQVKHLRVSRDKELENARKLLKPKNDLDNILSSNEFIEHHSKKKDIYLMAHEIVSMGRDYAECICTEELTDPEMTLLDEYIEEVESEEE